MSKESTSTVAADTFKCPTCDTKVLTQTGYCVKCKKKVSPKGASAGNMDVAHQLLRIAKLIASEGSPASTVPILAKAMKPEQLRQALIKWGIEITLEGEYKFYPLSPIGIPNLGQRPMVVKGDATAIRQCDHVTDGIQEKRDGYSGLLDKLSRMSKFLKLALRAEVTEDVVDDALFMFKSDIQPTLPKRAPRSPYMKKLVDGITEVRLAIGDSDFGKAQGEIDQAQKLIENAVIIWDKQLAAWVARKQLIKDIRDTLNKNPGMSREICTGVKPADLEEVEAAGPTVALDPSDNLVREISKTISDNGTLTFRYRKKDRTVRNVRVKPVRLVKNNEMLVGLDLDRAAERSFSLGNIVEAR